MNTKVARQADQGAMRFSFSWPILGLLIERSSYGYELMHRFERVYGDTLQLSGPKRIYEALEELYDRGLIEQVQADEPAPGPPRRPKVNYCASEKGIAAYQEWLVAEISDKHQRSWFFARQLAMLEPEAALGVIDRYERECVEEAHDAATRDATVAHEGVEGLVERLANEDERLVLGVSLSWLEYARRELTALVEQRAKRR
jgi:DNA-binding PadR family transcriptional regulator